MATKKTPILEGKTKATQKTIDIILNSMAEGLTQRDSAILAGISEDTLSLWKGQDSDFSEQIRQKQIEYKRKLLKTIEKASEKDWKACSWLLERKFSEEYSLKNNVRLDVNSSLEEIGNNIRKILTS